MRKLASVTLALMLSLPAIGQTPADRLIQAIRDDDLAFLKTELDKGADVNSTDSHGSTLLMLGAAYGSPDGVELLLARGADVNAKNQFDATALIWGANDPTKARMLVEKGAEVNASNKRGRTALMVAATCDGCASTVRMLVEKGANVKARDAQGVTALDAALEANDRETIRLLIDRGADTVSASLGGFTPLMGAAGTCDSDVVSLILSRGANVNATNTFMAQVKFGKIQMVHLSALMWALAPGCPAKVIEALLHAGANVNEIDIRNMTPLMFAVASEKQDLDVLKLLLKSGANPKLKSAMGETALDWALKFGNPEVIATLRSAGGVQGAPYKPPTRKLAVGRTPDVAVQSAMSLLQRSATEFFKQSGCVGCHHQPLVAMAFASVSGRAGVDEKLGREQIRVIQWDQSQTTELKLERFLPSPASDGDAYSLVSLGMAKVAANKDTDAAAVFVAGAQHQDGSWLFRGSSRSPMQEGTIRRTALSVRAIQLYMPPAKHAETNERLSRSRRWLLEAKPLTTDDSAMHLIGLYWTGASKAKLRLAAAVLKKQQNADGGWKQSRYLSSDAFATGEALWALKESGMLATTDAGYRRGVKFLLETQCEDGSWYIRSRAVKLQPYFQSGFPFDHDQWISAAGTAYAVMALAPVMNENGPVR